MTAQQVVDSISKDGLCVQRVNMATCLRSVMEAWTREKKAEVVAQQQAKGSTLVDHVVLGEYDLTLWKVQTADSHFLMVGLNGGQADPFDPKEQADRKIYGQVPWQTISKHMAAWVDTYGSVVVGSGVPRRTKLYMKWLTRLGYRLIPFMADDYRYGAIVSKETTRRLAEQLVEHLLCTLEC